MEKNNCLRCNFRNTDNGNCTAVGGFCTAVQAAHCPLLREYLDTGLTPERCAEFARADAEGRYIVMRDAEQEGVARLRELAEADKDGRVVVLPCRQGDELWTYCNYPVKRVYSFTVSDVSTLNGRTVLNTLGLGTIRPEDIGKTVFLTHEEAARAMQEMEGKKDG